MTDTPSKRRPRKELTVTAIERARPQSKPYRLSDRRGLYLIVNPNGARWWRFAYSTVSRRNNISLGVYPDVGIAEARQRRDDARKLIAKGIDPSIQRKVEKVAEAAATENTFRAVAKRWRGLELPNHANPETAALVWRRLELYVLPYIGNQPISEIETAEVARILDRIRQRGANATAGRIKVIIGQVCRFAIRRGLLKFDPTYPLRGERRQKEKHHAALIKPTDVARLMTAIQIYSGSPIVRAALILSAYLFQRPGEVRQMQWTEIDMEAGAWEIPAEKMKMRRPHLVPLPSQALNVLRDLQPLTGHRLNLKPDAPHYVLAGARSRLRPLSENAVRVALRTLGFGNDEMTPHGFRAMARTMLDEVLGFRPDLIEHQLAHEVRDPNGRAYNRTSHVDERRKMMQAWADYLDGLREDRNVD